MAVSWFIPQPVAGQPAPQTNDVELDARGFIHLVDRYVGYDIVAFDGSGQEVIGRRGELVIRQPMPSMPLGFWGDDDRSRYRAAYLDHYQGVWRHGDWATLTPHGTVIVTGRSDATLNPAGVRIGTAEIYRYVEQLDEVIEAIRARTENTSHYLMSNTE